ncbi:hypothetical protein CANCADRAFT_32264 [Tortispora caseinolytica NRRL Y-17796]|uniref:Uncharacterized protein n=1 Tax=Tortispora caseinolytica NRRL Y-17796 TaxID=767744 RepID=A0A1E4TAJ6_9ASCO|nr:hypothetical protein CANCADRAFT_32264 [Tortispora caseinolytica NRRL Y-17796]
MANFSENRTQIFSKQISGSMAKSFRWSAQPSPGTRPISAQLKQRLKQPIIAIPIRKY